MEKVKQTKSLFVRGIAETLNVCGCSLFFMVDTCKHGGEQVSKGLQKITGLVRKPSSLWSVSQGNDNPQLQQLYSEYGRARVKASVPGGDSTAEEKMKELLGKIKEISGEMPTQAEKKTRAESEKVISAKVVKESSPKILEKVVAASPEKARIKKTRAADAAQPQKKSAAKKDIPRPVGGKLVKKKLQAMLKADLIVLAKEMNIQCNSKLTKADIIELIWSNK